MKIKICGLKRPEDIEYVNQCMPDYIGFVFAGSKRRVTYEQAAALKKRLDPSIQAVGVFVNESLELVERLCLNRVIDVVQLHGDEDGVYIDELKKTVTNQVIKAVRVQSTYQILQAEKLPCDYLLLDTFTPGQYGGSGQCFDRRLIPELKKPFFLAGGISEGNVLEAVNECSPYCIDVSSSVETDGIKDREKISKMVHLVRKL